MAYHSTPHTTTGYSPYYFLHGREMTTPATENLKAKVPRPTKPLEEQLENLKAWLKMAYKTVAAANKRAHRANKDRYDARRVCAHLRKEITFTYITRQ
jgi:hypothetical protein